METQPGHTPNSDGPAAAQPPNAPEPANEQAPWSYASAPESQAPAGLSPIQPVTWTASEFVDHDKRVTWFLGLAGAAIIVAGIAHLLTRDIVTTSVIVIVAALFGITAGRKPTTLQYKIDTRGITIGNKFYPYGQFRSFSVIEEGALSSIQLMPIGRFAPAISLYFPPDQEEQIISTLGSYLPHEDRKRDIVDRFMHKIRF